MRQRAGEPDDTTGMARPRSFEARYGDGVGRAVCLGGGGTWFVAWQLGYLHRLAHHGVHLESPDRLVGTSAGSIVAATLARGRLQSMFLESEVLAMVPGVMEVLLPTSLDHPSQQAALDRYLSATDAEVDTVRSIGRAAGDAVTPGPDSFAGRLLPVVGDRWHADSLWMTTVDTGTGERCVVTRDTGVSMARGAAASSAVPGIFAPQPVAGRNCMDGGVSGSAIHLDLVAGADKALVISFFRDDQLHRPRMTLVPGGLTRELDGLRASGTDVLLVTPAVHPVPDDTDVHAAVHAVMDPALAGRALEQGAAQADQEFGTVASFWG